MPSFGSHEIQMRQGSRIVYFLGESMPCKLRIWLSYVCKARLIHFVAIFAALSAGEYFNRVLEESLLAFFHVVDATIGRG